jgi:hypothetical protein
VVAQERLISRGFAIVIGWSGEAVLENRTHVLGGNFAFFQCRRARKRESSIVGLWAEKITWRRTFRGGDDLAVHSSGTVARVACRLEHDKRGAFTVPVWEG